MQKRNGIHSTLDKLLPTVAYTIVIIFVFGKALIPPNDQMIFGPDIWRYHYYQKTFATSALSQGVFPWWNPYIFSGMPYGEHPQVTLWYPLNVLFIMFTPAQVFSFYLAVHLGIAMVGMYSLCRIWTSRMAAWIAGIAYGLSGFFVARIYAGHVDLISASAWTPLVVGLFWQAMLGPTKRTVVKAGVALAIQIFAGYQTIAVFTTEAVGLAAVLVSIQKKTLRPLVTAVFAGIIGLGLGAVQILPSGQFVGRSIRTFSLPQAWTQTATPTIAHLLELVDYSWFYEYIPKVPLGHEHASYIGKLPLLAALATVLWVIRRKVKRTEVWFFILISVLAYWIALGHNAPVDVFSHLRTFVPLYSQLRIPSRHVLLFVLGASALSGIGIGRVAGKRAQIIIAALVLVDLVPFGKHNIVLGSLPAQREDSELVAFLQKDPSLFRILPNYYHGDATRENLEFNAPMTHGLYSASGYDSPPLRNYYEFLMAVNGLDSSQIIPYLETIPPFTNITSAYTDGLNIKYIMVPIVDDSLLAVGGERFVLVREDAQRGYRLYENRTVLPRYFFVPSISREPNRDAVALAIRAQRFDPRETVLVDQKTIDGLSLDENCTPGQTGHVDVVSYTPNRIALHTRSSCNGYIASSEVYYPGWEATIDGKRAQLFEGNLAFRTLYIPKGNHTVVMTYRPTIFLLGAAVSAGTLLLCMIWLYKNKTD